MFVLVLRNPLISLREDEQGSRTDNFVLRTNRDFGRTKSVIETLRIDPYGGVLELETGAGLRAFVVAGQHRQALAQHLPGVRIDMRIAPEAHDPAVSFDRCLRCGKPLPESLGSRGRKYCSQTCIGAAFMHRQRIDREKEHKAYQEAWLKAWQARQPDRICTHCGGAFKPRSLTTKAKYCSQECYQASRRSTKRKG